MIPRQNRSVPATDFPNPSIGAEFLLAQPWNADPHPEFRPAHVWMGWTSDGLHMRARLPDDEIVTQATSDNERLWQLGDVFEIFLMIQGRTDYVELQVSPNNKRLHLHLPGIRGKIEPAGEAAAFETMLVSPVGFEASVACDANEWRVTVMVPPRVFDLEKFEPGLELRVACARYDAGSTSVPILSTTACHPIIDFHRPEEWTGLRLDEPF